MSDAAATLSYAVRPWVVAKYLAQLGLMFAILTAGPLIASLVFGEHAFSVRYAVLITVVVLAATPFVRLPAPAHIQTNEALSIIALIFLLVPLAAGYPMMAAGLSFGDAWFEAVSAVTTTGLTLLADVGDKPRTFLFARAWMQWYGGLGIVVLSVALLMGHHVVTRRLAEPIGSETLLTTTRTHARRMLAIYVVLTAAGLAVVWILSGDAFGALTHVLAAVSTGGFAPHNASLGAVDSAAVRGTIIAIAFLGAVPFPLYLLLKGGWPRLFRDVELRALVAACVFVGALLTLLLHHDLGIGWDAAAGHGLLLGFSAQTTTGFTSLEVARLDAAAKLVLIVAMFVGGGLGSTAGGVKLLRLLILLRLARLTVQRCTMPLHAVAEPRLGGRVLDSDDVQRALLLILLFVIVIVLSWLAFLLFGYPPLDALFEVVSATGTVGLTTGITAATLEPFLKGVLCADMLFGRLEIVALLVLLYPRNWIGSRVR